MKKIVILLLAALLVVGLAACGADVTTGATESNNSSTSGNNQTTSPTESTGDNTVPEEYFCFTYQGVELIPGALFDASVLPEPESTYEVPSCAIEGMDVVYNYGTFEITVFDDGTKGVIYSIYMIDANTPTNEGLYMGDGADTVLSLYGGEYTEDGTQWTYVKGDTMLCVIYNNDCVVSIEFRMVTE